MGRTYAGALGLIAFVLMSVRGVVAGGGAEETVLAACAALFAFAALGYVVGQLADHLVSESVRTQFQVAMSSWEQKQNEEKATKR